jgi:hypothetical protein
VQANDIIVDDIPKHLGRNATHSIYTPQHNLHIPLQRKGIFSCIPICAPTMQEIETCPWIKLTSKEEWNPHFTYFEEQEETIAQTQQQVIQSAPAHYKHHRSKIKPEQSADLWQIGLDLAKLTIQATTQLAIHILYSIDFVQKY